MYGQRKLQVLIFFFLGFSIVSEAQELRFANTSLSNIKKASKNLDKPFLVYLYSVDSPDCRLMESTTFKDAEIIEVLNNNLLALQLDVASEEGQKIVKKKKIHLTPGILFYDTQGKLLLQQESTIESVSFLKILELLYDIKPKSSDNTEETLAEVSEGKIKKVVAAQMQETTVSNESNAPQDTSILKKTNRHQKTETTQEKILPQTIPTVDTVNEDIQKDIPRKTIKLKAGQIPNLSREIIDSAKLNDMKSPVELFEIEEREIEVITVYQFTNEGIDPLERIRENQHIVIELPQQLEINSAEEKPDVEQEDTTYDFRTKAELVEIARTSIEELNLSPRQRKIATAVTHPPKVKLVNNVVSKTIIHEYKNPIVNSITTETKTIKKSTVTKNRLVQLGAYIKYDDVLKSMYRLNKKIDIPLTIVEEVTNGRKMYKLITSDPMSHSDATILARSFKQKSIDCFVRKSI